MSAQLLPPNAPAIMRALADAAVLGDALPVDTLRGFKVRPDPAPGIRPWLIHEYGLADIEPYLPADRVLTDGLKWSRLRGSAAALPAACRWLGLDTTLEEPAGRRWCDLELAASSRPASISDVRALAVASLPARARLYRIYGSYDLRPAQYDARTWDGAIWDADSGVDVDGVRVSFAARYASAAPVLPRHAAAGLHTVQLSSARRRTAAWDGWRWDEPQRLRDAGSTLSRQVGAAIPAAVRRLVVTLSLRSTAPQLSYATRAAVPQLSTRHDADALKPRRGWSGPWRGRVRRTAASKLTFLTE